MRSENATEAANTLRALRLVDHPGQASALPANPAAEIISGAEIGPDTNAIDRLGQRLLHVHRCTHLDKGRDAVADQLDRCEQRPRIVGVELPLFLGEEARIAANRGAFARDIELEEGLPEIIRPADVRNHALLRLIAGVHMGVDEARRDEHACAVDLVGDLAGEIAADEDDRVTLIDDFTVPYEGVVTVIVADDPAAFDARSHPNVSSL